jgi:hypothetical protein
VLKIPLFEHTKRYTETRKATRYVFDFDPGEDGLYVMVGIHVGARMLVEGVDYRVEGRAVVFPSPPAAVLDISTGCAWPERFNRAEIARRRKETRTLNAWDSQYGLEAKPLTEVRLDPARITPYDVQPILRESNGASSLWLGKVRIVGAACRWDPSSGKLKSDASALAALLQDDAGRRYVQHVGAVTGEVAEFAEDGKTITGGQVWQICDVVEQLNLPRITVETNGIGQFAPSILRAALKQRGLVRCAVVTKDSVANKNNRILEALEPLLLSRGMLWAHVDVLRTVKDGVSAHSAFWTQMRDWNPAVKEQPDDFLDALAGAVTETPERFKGKVGKPTTARAHDWRPAGGTHEVAFER